jgi:hypothetical protein
VAAVDTHESRKKGTGRERKERGKKEKENEQFSNLSMY